MIGLEEARRRVLDAVEPLAPEERSLELCLGLAPAEDVVAPRDVPPFDNSAMDGYAVRTVDVSRVPVVLDVVAVSAAGRPAPRGIGPGQAARILTGAVMVEGADAVVAVEETDGGSDRVEIRAVPAPGAHVRRAGEDVSAGGAVLPRGTLLGPAHVGVAASVGRDRILVRRPPRVAVVSTGDELVAPGTPGLEPGQIYESNSFLVQGLVERMLPCGPHVTRRHMPDHAGRIRGVFVELAGSHDVVLSSGGVSMGGEYDVVKSALSDLGVEFWKVAVKPAKPMGFGILDGAMFVGLPGNPVSVGVSFEVFVRPMLRAMMGVAPAVPATVRGTAGEALRRGDDGRTHFVRVRYDTEGCVVSTGSQGSHILSGLAGADALAVLGPDVLEVPAGGSVELMPLWTR